MMAEGTAAANTRQLSRDLTLWPAFAMVVGSVVGVNIFIKPAVMAQALPSGPALLGVWVAAGLISVAAALLYAELGAMFPVTGGDYVYLRESYGPAIGFVYVWMTILIRATVNIATFALAMGGFLSSVVPLGKPWLDYMVTVHGDTLHFQFGWRQIAGIAFLALLGAINCRGVRAGAASQTVLTAIKIAGAAVLIAGAFFAHPVSHAAPAVAAPFTGDAFVTTMLAALLSFNGWAWISFAAEEVREPERTIPKVLIGGTAAVIGVYCLLNWTYLHLLGIQEIAASNSSRFPTAPTVGAKAAAAIFGPVGSHALSVLFLISALGVANACILSASRVPYALSRDGLFFPAFGKLNGRNVPALSIVSGVCAGGALTVIASYDHLTDIVMFAQWIFYTLTAFSVIVLRWKGPHRARPYRAPAYPVLPLGVAIFGAFLVVMTLRAKPLESLLAVVLIVSGLPAFVLFRRLRRSEAVREAAAAE